MTSRRNSCSYAGKLRVHVTHALRVHVTQLGAGTKFGGARRRARAVSGVSGKVLAIHRPAIAAFALCEELA